MYYSPCLVYKPYIDITLSNWVLFIASGPSKDGVEYIQLHRKTNEKVPGNPQCQINTSMLANHSRNAWIFEFGYYNHQLNKRAWSNPDNSVVCGKYSDYSCPLVPFLTCTSEFISSGFVTENHGTWATSVAILIIKWCRNDATLKQCAPWIRNEQNQSPVNEFISNCMPRHFFFYLNDVFLSGSV